MAIVVVDYDPVWTAVFKELGAERANRSP